MRLGWAWRCVRQDVSSETRSEAKADEFGVPGKLGIDVKCMVTMNTTSTTATVRNSQDLPSYDIQSTDLLLIATGSLSYECIRMTNLQAAIAMSRIKTIKTNQFGALAKWPQREAISNRHAIVRLAAELAPRTHYEAHFLSPTNITLAAGNVMGNQGTATEVRCLNRRQRKALNRISYFCDDANREKKKRDARRRDWSFSTWSDRGPLPPRSGTRVSNARLRQTGRRQSHSQSTEQGRR